jgi:hypothetical protein
MGYFALDGFSIIRCDGGGGTRPETGPSCRAGSREHHEEIRTQAAYELVHARFGACPHRDHNNNSGHANDDAKGGQHAAKHINAKGPERRLKGI